MLALDGSNWQRVDLFDFQTDVEVGRIGTKKVREGVGMRYYRAKFFVFVCLVVLHTSSPAWSGRAGGFFYFFIFNFPTRSAT